MKLLTPEEEKAHSQATINGGIFGGALGLGFGSGGILLARQRYPFFRSLTLPLQAFLATSAATFGAIIVADRASRNFERARDVSAQQYEQERRDREAERRRAQGLSTTEQALAWANGHKYHILAGSWAASMGLSWHLVNRDKFMTGPQKLVQARVYAQGFTVLAMLATAALEISQARKGEGKYQTIRILDPNDPDHKRVIEKKVHEEQYQGQDTWKDMIESEERRIKRKEEQEHEAAERDKREYPDTAKKRHERHKK